MRRLDPITTVFLVLAGAWAVVQFGLAFFVHVARVPRFTSTGLVALHTKTYIQAFAGSEVTLTIVVLGAVVIVAVLLQRRLRGDEFGAGRLAWGLSVATLIFGIVGFRYLFGVGLLLCVACASARRHLPVDGRGTSHMRRTALG